MAVGPVKKGSGWSVRETREAGTGITLRKAWRPVLAVLLFAASTYFALTRENRPDPLVKHSVFSWQWWLQPLEINAPARLPVVSGTLTSIAVKEDGSEAYLAGQKGMVLRYRSSSERWEKLTIPDSLGRPLTPLQARGRRAE